MFPTSADVSAGDTATATQYNNLRDDIFFVSNFGDGSDGALSVTSGTTTVDLGGASLVILQYTSLSISGGATLAFSNPASGGTIVIIKVQNNVTIAGTIDMRNMGAAGNTTANSVSRTSTGTSSGTGGDGTNAYNNLGQTRNGAGGVGSTPSIDAQATQATGGKSMSNAITAALAALVSRGIAIAPGGGGATGGVAANLQLYTSGTFTATAGTGGRGAGALGIFCGGDYDDTGGTINLSGTAGTNASTSTGSSGQYALAAGGGGGGAASDGFACVRGSITSAGTYTVTGGAGGTKAQNSVGGSTGTASDGSAGSSGSYKVVPI